MTFGELVRAACEVAGPTDSVNVEVEAWRFVHADGPQPIELSWRIWSGERSKSWYGPTPEVALALMREDYGVLRTAVDAVTVEAR